MPCSRRHGPDGWCRTRGRAARGPAWRSRRASRSLAHRRDRAMPSRSLGPTELANPRCSPSSPGSSTPPPDEGASAMPWRHHSRRAAESHFFRKTRRCCPARSRTTSPDRSRCAAFLDLTGAAGPRRSSSGWGCPRLRLVPRRSSQAARRDVWRWPALSSPSPRHCCSTNRSTGWTTRPRNASSPTYARPRERRVARWCS